MSVNEAKQLSDILKGVLMEVGREDIPIIDNRILYNPGLSSYFDGAGSMKKFVIVGTNGTVPDPIELGTIVLLKRTITPKKSMPMSEPMDTESVTYQVEKDKIVIKGIQKDTSGKNLVDDVPVTYYQVRYNDSKTEKTEKTVEISEATMKQLLKLKGSRQEKWPEDNWVTSRDNKVENARTKIGGIGKRSDDESTMGHNMTTIQRRKLLERLKLSSIGMRLYCSTTLGGGHCYDCRQWTCAMLETMPKDLYDAICNKHVPYSCCSSDAQGGIDHCYVTFASDETTPDQWIQNTEKIEVFDLWYREQFNQLSDKLHYNLKTYEDTSNLNDQMKFEKINNDEKNGMQKWLKGIPLEHLNRAKTNLYAAQAEIFFKSVHAKGPSAMQDWDKKMLALLEAVEKKSKHSFGMERPEITVQEMAQLEAWVMEINTRKGANEDKELCEIMKIWSDVRYNIDSYWDFVKARLNGSTVEQEEKDKRMQHITSSMENGLYVDNTVQDQWTLLYFADQIKNCTNEKDCLNIVDRVSLFYALMNCDYMDDEEIKKQSNYCEELYQACLDKGKGLTSSKQKRWKGYVDAQFGHLKEVTNEMITSWNQDKKDSVKVTQTVKLD